MDANPQVSVVTTAAKRSKIVALQDWQLEDGSPLCVLCTEVEAEACARETGVLPGERPKLGIDADDPAPVQLETAERMLRVFAAVIELGTSLRGPDGVMVRPAFHFGSERPRHELSLDGSKLSETDLAELGTTTLKLSGHMGGAAEARFLSAGRGRLGDGHGAGAVLPLVPHDAPPGAR